jgi:hypothetical protein
MMKNLKITGKNLNHGQEEHVEIQDARPKSGSVSVSLTLSFWIREMAIESSDSNNHCISAVFNGFIRTDFDETPFFVVL